jgi:hypothetical protein
LLFCLLLMQPCSVRCFIKSRKICNDKVNSTLNWIHWTFSLLLAVKYNNCNKFQIKNHASPSLNFSDPVRGCVRRFWCLMYTTTDVKHNLW